MRSSLIGRSNIRFLVATALVGEGMIGIIKPISKHQIDQIKYDSGTEINFGTALAPQGEQKSTRDTLSRDVNVDQAVDMIVTVTAVAAKQEQIKLPCNQKNLREGLTTWLRKFFGKRTTMSIREIVKALESLKSSASYGPWQGWTTTTKRLIASVCSAAFGKNWLNTNLNHIVGKVEQALALYTYDVNDVVVGDEIDYEAVAKATPKGVYVIGAYEIAGGVIGRYVGTIPALPMASNASMALPAFVPLSPNGKSMTSVISLIKSGPVNLNTMFKSPNGGYFTFNRETLAMMRFNHDSFVAQLNLAVCYNDGKVAQVKASKNAYGTFMTARTGFLKALTSGFVIGSNPSTVSTIETPTATDLDAAFGEHPEHELVGAGSSTSSSSDPFAPNS